MSPHVVTALPTKVQIHAVPLSVGPPLAQCPPSRGLSRTKWHLDPSNRLATIHQRYRQDNGPVAQGEPLPLQKYKLNLNVFEI